MKYAPYVLKHLRNNWVRSGSTVMGMAVGIMLMCTLGTLVAAIGYSLANASARRLITRNAVSLNFLLPLSYKARMQALPGVRRVSNLTFFAGRYQDGRNAFANFAIDPEDFLAMYPEIMLAPAERTAFLRERASAIVGRELAARLGWKVGDTVQLTSGIPVFGGGQPLTFVVRGLYELDRTRAPAGNASAFYFHFDYLYEASQRRAWAMTYNVEVARPDEAASVSRAIDAVFENSDAQTKTETEAAFAASFISLAGEITILLDSIGLAVGFAILLVAANTMSMAVRERQTEIAVLKTLGFSSAQVLGLVLAEALTLGLASGVLGVCLAWLSIRSLQAAPGIGAVLAEYTHLGLTPTAVALGLILGPLVALLAGSLPALEAYRARITDMLAEA